jgi:hypothetical protein
MVESREQDSEASEDESSIVEVGSNSLSDAGILDFDGDGLSIAGESAVHLTD